MKTYEDGLKEAWERAREFCPELPERYETEIFKLGTMYETERHGRVIVLLGDTESNAVIVYNDAGHVEEIDRRELIGPGVESGLLDYCKRVLAPRQDPVEEIRGNLGGYRDDATGTVYRTIADWVRGTGLSESSGYRLSAGMRDEIQGHTCRKC